MIEHIRKMTCDVCGRNKIICVNDLENYYYAPLLKEKAPDWVSVDFKRFDEDDSKRIHLCPDCNRKFLVLFEKEKKKENNRCVYCNSFNRHMDADGGWCDVDGMSHDVDDCCRDFKKRMSVDADGNEKRCDKCFHFKLYETWGSVGKCTHDGQNVYAYNCCEMFAGM